MMRDIIQNWQGTDAELLAELNAKTIKRVINNGLVTMATVAAVSQELAAAAGLLFKKASMFYGSPVDGETETEAETRQGRHELFLSYYERFRSASIGAPIDSDAFRQNFTYHALVISQVIGIVTPWTQETVDAFLSFGAVMESHASQVLPNGRDATQEDVNAERRAISRGAAVSSIVARANKAKADATLVFDADGEAEAITAAGIAGWGA